MRLVMIRRQWEQTHLIKIALRLHVDPIKDRGCRGALRDSTPLKERSFSAILQYSQPSLFTGDFGGKLCARSD